MVKNDVVQNTTYNELVTKKLLLLIQTNKILYCDKKIPDTSKFIATQHFSRLTKIHFNARMTEESKKLATKKQ